MTARTLAPSVRSSVVGQERLLALEIAALLSGRGIDLRLERSEGTVELPRESGEVGQ